MKIEEAQKVIDWAKEKPTVRKAEITITNGEVSAFVYDKILAAGQILKAGDEINIEVEKEKAEYERLKEKFEGGN